MTDTRDALAQAHDALSSLDARLRLCAELPITAAEAYDSFYQGVVKDALAALSSLEADSTDTADSAGAQA